ncbi:hypothetical protein M4D81_24815 [Paenibacillus sp. p3-SID867]|uniref:hypothetical protein n=1 Tax=Paenibacillus sp. p3-SID867 TaxID=2916363 RepID=UPI0021A558E6|nr:hypothetical protein [Paenibacillus sp. p3-SID867]MCT1402223.1 hypothetical protein [Paenibacillus sp. p3-SID867]
MPGRKEAQIVTCKAVSHGKYQQEDDQSVSGRSMPLPTKGHQDVQLDEKLEEMKTWLRIGKRYY